MKKLAVAMCLLITALPMSAAQARDVVVRITSMPHQTFSGEFRNDELSQELTPSGALGLLVFTPKVANKVWVIDASLVDEVIAMTGDYKLATDATPIGTNIAKAWLKQLRQISYGDQVIALAYGNPDVSIARQLAPSELRKYFSYGKLQLESALGRSVRSEPNTKWSIGKSGISNTLRKQYGDNRKALTRLSRVVSDPQLLSLRAKLGKLLSPQLDRDSGEYYSYSARAAVDSTINKLRINSGKYQITTSSVKLPVTVINDFSSDVTINISMLPINARVIVDSFTDVMIPARSKKQLEMLVEVIAPGETTVSAFITDSEGNDVVPEATLALNSTVIDAKVTWFTTGAAILVLLAGVAQSVRRVRRRSK